MDPVITYRCDLCGAEAPAISDSTGNARPPRGWLDVRIKTETMQARAVSDACSVVCLDALLARGVVCVRCCGSGITELDAECSPGRGRCSRCNGSGSEP